jgi:hypothetical protein
LKEEGIYHKAGFVAPHTVELEEILENHQTRILLVPGTERTNFNAKWVLDHADNDIKAIDTTKEPRMDTILGRMLQKNYNVVYDSALVGGAMTHAKKWISKAIMDPQLGVEKIVLRGVLIYNRLDSDTAKLNRVPSNPLRDWKKISSRVPNDWQPPVTAEEGAEEMWRRVKDRAQKSGRACSKGYATSQFSLMTPQYAKSVLQDVEKTINETGKVVTSGTFSPAYNKALLRRSFSKTLRQWVDFRVYDNSARADGQPEPIDITARFEEARNPY